ncbi:MAG: hypothetical protein H8D46_00320 [FCB group bacterium]|nr:hypothetical protein [FCB group bacterium]
MPAFFGSLFIGLIGAKLIAAGQLNFQGVIIDSIDKLTDPEKLMPVMAKSLLNPWVAGVFISGAIAAMMSTADSQLLVSTTVLTQDIFKRFFNNLISGFKLLTVVRILTILIGLIAFLLAWKSEELVFETVSYAWGGLGASFGPALVFSLWWKRTTRSGIIAGMLSGTFFTIWPIFAEAVTPRLTAFLIAAAAVWIISHLFPDKS